MEEQEWQPVRIAPTDRWCDKDLAARFPIYVEQAKRMDIVMVIPAPEEFRSRLKCHCRAFFVEEKASKSFWKEQGNLRRLRRFKKALISECQILAD